MELSYVSFIKPMRIKSMIREFIGIKEPGLTKLEASKSGDVIIEILDLRIFVPRYNIACIVYETIKEA